VVRGLGHLEDQSLPHPKIIKPSPHLSGSVGCIRIHNLARPPPQENRVADRYWATISPLYHEPLPLALVVPCGMHHGVLLHGDTLTRPGTQKNTVAGHHLIMVLARSFHNKCFTDARMLTLSMQTATLLLHCQAVAAAGNAKLNAVTEVKSRRFLLACLAGLQKNMCMTRCTSTFGPCDAGLAGFALREG